MRGNVYIHSDTVTDTDLRLSYLTPNPDSHTCLSYLLRQTQTSDSLTRLSYLTLMPDSHT